jgi:hypothetical protein
VIEEMNQTLLLREDKTTKALTVEERLSLTKTEDPIKTKNSKKDLTTDPSNQKNRKLKS